MGTANVTECFFQNRQETARQLANHLADRLRFALARGQDPLLILSGGQSPIETFNLLSRADLSWERVWVTLSDERWVPEYHPDSNAGMLRREFLINQAAACRFTPLYSDTRSPLDGSADTAAALDKLPATATVTLLGMGDDGHTASLFPGAPDLDAILASPASVEAVFPPGTEPRLTLTPKRLLATDEVDLLIFGQQKLDVFERARQTASVNDLPVSLLTRQTQVPVRLYWSP